MLREPERETYFRVFVILKDWVFQHSLFIPKLKTIVSWIESPDFKKTS